MSQKYELLFSLNPLNKFTCKYIGRKLLSKRAQELQIKSSIAFKRSQITQMTTYIYVNSNL